MATKLHGLRTAIYFTNDLNKAKEWYTNAFGIAPYFDEPFYVGFNVGGYELGLHPTEGNMDAAGTVATAYWGVDDVHKSFADLLAAGATSVEDPTDVGGGIIIGAVKDPWGNVFGLIYNPHFSLA